MSEINLNQELSNEEEEILSFMLMISPKVGIGYNRLLRWSIIENDCAKELKELCDKGWIEYNEYEIDLLENDIYDDEKINDVFTNNIRGVYYMKESVQELIRSQKNFVLLVMNYEKLISICLDWINNYKKIKFANIEMMAFEQIKHCATYLEIGYYIPFFDEIEKCNNDIVKLLEGYGMIIFNSNYDVEKRIIGLRYIEKSLNNRLAIMKQSEEKVRDYKRVIRINFISGQYKMAESFMEAMVEIRKSMWKERLDLNESYKNISEHFLELGLIDKYNEYQNKAIKVLEQL